MKISVNYKYFSSINGEHPLRQAVPEGYIDYAVRRRRHGRVFYFNYPLAREMGLITAKHPDEMNADLHRVLLDTFSIQIINEYDLEQGVKIPLQDRLPGQYMATRYLQIQHPGRQGKTSGDGRGIWNGYFKGRRGAWDISSCGTGTTALSPGVVKEGRFIKTGDENVSYGNGRADLSDGVCAAMMSEIYYHTGIATERTLVIISFPDGTAINVRATTNLLRPAHFFMHIKQNNLAALDGLLEYYIDRQVVNGHYPRIANREKRYRHFLAAVTQDFARMAARFESDYIFCWLDWDGDNILMNGGIIDYGSLRQFGLFHHAYRYDDIERMSTTITEQKRKARYIVQTFTQIVTSLLQGNKKNIKNFSQQPSLKLFDKLFLKEKDEFFLYRMGVDPSLLSSLGRSPVVKKSLRAFKKYYDYFERAKSKKGLYPVNDGISWDAIFCMRDCMREMPGQLLDMGKPFSVLEFISLIKSRYASDDDVTLTPYRGLNSRFFQQSYQQLVAAIAATSEKTVEQILKKLQQRSALINRHDRITGDAVIYVAEQFIDAADVLGKKQHLQLFNDFINAEVLSPEFQASSPRCFVKYASKIKEKKIFHRVDRLYLSLIQTVIDHREGL